MKTNLGIILAIAVGALLMGLLAFAPTAAAEVVYTPANVTISGDGYIKIDLNHDAITDFLHSALKGADCGTTGGGYTGSTRIIPTTGDGIVVSHLNFASLLASGISVGASSTFYNAGTIVAQLKVCGSSSKYASGYLGLEFQINGQTHYGWAQVDISVHSGFRHGMRTTLIGFAYETIPGRAIKTGQTASNFSETGPTPVSINPIDSHIGSQLVAQNSSFDELSKTGTLGFDKDGREHTSASDPISLKHPLHYKVIDTTGFGGPNSHINEGGRLLNNSGIFTGYADTLDPDPYAPDECWDGDCLVAHTFRWSDGKLTELGVIGGGPNSESNWISESGLIAGDSQNGLLDPLVDFWQIRGTLWRGSETIDIGALDGGYNSLARSVNSDGVVVGLSTTLIPDPNALIMFFGLPYAFQTRAFRWKDGVLQDLGTLGGPDAMAMGVNERGQIVGNSYTSLDPSPVCGNLNPDISFDSLTTGAFLWQNGKMTNLGSFGGTCTNATAINNRGQVVGFSFLAGDTVLHPFSWERGKLVDLGTLGGSQAMALHVNDAGDIVGWSLATNESIMHATLWSRGQITDLGAFEPDQCSFPLDINSRTQVVGYVVSNCDFSDPSSHRAFLWEPGQPMVDLNTLISPSLGIQLLNAASINDRGEMAAVAFFPDGSHRPVLLVPCNAQEGNGEDCQDSGSLSAFSTQTSSTQNSSTQNSISGTQRSSSVTQAHVGTRRNGPLLPTFRPLMVRRYRTPSE